MNNPYLIQLIGLILAAAGLIALSAAGYLYGRPLTREERLRRDDTRRNVQRLPLNIETLASAAVTLMGVGILIWSNFNFCSFLNYWLPGLPYGLKIFLSCR